MMIVIMMMMMLMMMMMTMMTMMTRWGCWVAGGKCRVTNEIFSNFTNLNVHPGPAFIRLSLATLMMIIYKQVDSYLCIIVVRIGGSGAQQGGEPQLNSKEENQLIHKLPKSFLFFSFSQVSGGFKSHYDECQEAILLEICTGTELSS